MTAAHQPTDEKRAQVHALASFGIPHKRIATYVGISHETLYKYYSDELENGKTEANLTVAKSLFEQATSGNTAAAIFWLKSQAGWSDKGNADYADSASDADDAIDATAPAQIAIIGVQPATPDDENGSSDIIEGEATAADGSALPAEGDGE